MLFYLLVRVCGSNNYKRIILLSIILSLGGLIYCDLVSIRLPWYVDISCATMFCWGIGYVIKKNYNPKYNSWICRYWFPICFMLFNAVLYLTVKNERYVISTVDIHNAVFGNWMLWICGAVLGSAFIAVLSIKWLKSSKLLNYIGENSIVYFLYAWTARPITSIFVKLCEKHGMVSNIVLWVMEIVVVICVCSIESMFIKRYIPELIGKKRANAIFGRGKGEL